RRGPPTHHRRRDRALRRRGEPRLARFRGHGRAPASHDRAAPALRRAIPRRALEDPLPRRPSPLGRAAGRQELPLRAAQPRRREPRGRAAPLRFGARRPRLRIAAAHFARTRSSPASGRFSFPLLTSRTACATARATLRTSSCTSLSRSSSSWLVAYGL